MYGKFFSSTFTGSMVGAGPDVFAVWGYVVANTVDSYVELNPILLAAILGCSEERVQAAIDYLCAPDSRSRNVNHDGRRMIRTGQFSYHVTGHSIYRQIRTEEERREYNRIKKQESRARQRGQTKSNGEVKLPSASGSVYPDPDSSLQGSPKDLTGSAGVDDAKVPCPIDLRLTDSELGALAIGIGIQRWQADAMAVPLVAKFQTQAKRPLSAWRRSLVTAITRDWSDPAKRPTKREETPDELAKRREKNKESLRRAMAKDPEPAPTPEETEQNKAKVQGFLESLGRQDD